MHGRRIGGRRPLSGRRRQSMKSRQPLALAVCCLLLAMILLFWGGVLSRRSTVQELSTRVERVADDLDLVPQSSDLAPQSPNDDVMTEDNASDADLSFFVVGDWGSDPHHGPMRNSQLAVRDAMSAVASHSEPAFVLSTGDQVYPSGLPADSRKAQQRMQLSFVDTYLGKHLNVPFYPTLGNHDCEGDREQLLHFRSASTNSRPKPEWNFPAPYYSQRFEVAPGVLLMVWSLDACTLVCSFPVEQAGFNERNDRCDGVKTYGAMERQQQVDWLHQELEAAQLEGVAFKVVMSHWPIFSFAGNGPTKELILDLLPLLEEYDVDIYFDGHDHNLQHIQKETGAVREQAFDVTNGLPVGEAGVDFFVSGAGGYELHPFLKGDAGKTWNEGAVLKKLWKGHGFMEVSLYAMTTGKQPQKVLLDCTDEIQSTDAPRAIRVTFYDATTTTRQGPDAGVVYEYTRCLR